MPIRPPHIALIVETSIASGREILRGISKYMTENGPWSIFHQPSGLNEELPRWIEKWNGDGIIARIGRQEIAAAIRKTKIPCIDVLGEVEESQIPLVHINNESIALAAFEHLRQRGFRHYAFVGGEGLNWSDQRADGFQRFVEQSGHKCQRFFMSHQSVESPWEEEQDLLASWLLGLPKPCGLMACNDPRGQRTLEACRRAEIHVPEEIAVIGVDNDSVLCTLSSPSLSSINAGHFHVGYQGALRLDRLMRGESVEPAYLVDRYVCVARESTDASAVENPVLASALAYIRQNACQDITSSRVAKHVGMSLSTLKRLFANEYSHPVNRCIIAARIDRAKVLLRDTDLSIEQITQRVGYGHAHYFSLAFRREVGVTPSIYRREHSSLS